MSATASAPSAPGTS
uniref:Uncharacterized protein n=1 Tax=Arundo donax TaxID=35708 RepID=A0A0A8ZXM1_ARUDO